MPTAVSNKYVSYVEAIGKWDKGAPDPLDVEFYGHAAVFNLERDHSCFGHWLAMLKESEQEHSTIIFTYGGNARARMRIRSVELGDNLRGIVEEIFHGMENDSIGFKMPQYAGIFLIPNDHPRLVDWLALVRKSKNAHIKIVFAYDAYRRRVTSMALAQE